MVMPGRGFLDEEFTDAYPTIIPLEGGQAVRPSGIRLPLRPSMGLVATTYQKNTASDSRPSGGVIDIKEPVSDPGPISSSRPLVPRS